MALHTCMYFMSQNSAESWCLHPHTPLLRPHPLRRTQWCPFSVPSSHLSAMPPFTASRIRMSRDSEENSEDCEDPHQGLKVDIQLHSIPSHSIGQVASFWCQTHCVFFFWFFTITNKCTNICNTNVHSFLCEFGFSYLWNKCLGIWLLIINCQSSFRKKTFYIFISHA